MNNSITVGPLVFLVINVCNRGEHYETPCIIICAFVGVIVNMNFVAFYYE